MRATSNTWTTWSTALLLASPTAAFHPLLRSRQADTTFDWSTITPTPDLQYHDCYTKFKCARLQVPLDWTNPNSSAHAAIGIITLPAVVAQNDPAYAGPLLTNPGGPGGAGVDLVLSIGETMQALADTPGQKHFDVVGFDPRGMGRSTPSASCYASEFDRLVNQLQGDGLTAVGGASVRTEAGLRVKVEGYKGLGALCAEQGADGIFQHMSTADVARDMLEFVDRAEALKVKNGNGTASAEKPRLQYIGFSYGSQLGNTFASMFPGRVGRMVVDGIVDAEDYTSGAWQMNLNDAEKVVDIFYQTCFDAGDKCPLRQTKDKSVANIRKRVTALLRSLKDQPISAVYAGRIYLVTSLLVSETLRTSLYDPIGSYESLAYKLADALAGNYTRILSSSLAMPVEQSSLCDAIPSTSSAAYTWADEAAAGVICGDSFATAGDRSTLSWARDVVSEITTQSPTIGEPWTRLPLACAGWKFNPPYAFKGPFGSPAPDASGANSSVPLAPLLILSTKTDHATPLRNAYTLQGLHKGSAVVMQDSVGHCALLSSVSVCTYGIVRNYLLTGKVPANGTVCKADCVPGIPYKECPGLPAA